MYRRCLLGDTQSPGEHIPNFVETGCRLLSQNLNLSDSTGWNGFLITELEFLGSFCNVVLVTAVIWNIKVNYPLESFHIIILSIRRHIYIFTVTSNTRFFSVLVLHNWLLLTMFLIVLAKKTKRPKSNFNIVRTVLQSCDVFFSRTNFSYKGFIVCKKKKNLLSYSFL